MTSRSISAARYVISLRFPRSSPSTAQPRPAQTSTAANPNDGSFTHWYSMGASFDWQMVVPSHLGPRQPRASPTSPAVLPGPSHPIPFHFLQSIHNLLSPSSSAPLLRYLMCRCVESFSTRSPRPKLTSRLGVMLIPVARSSAPRARRPDESPSPPSRNHHTNRLRNFRRDTCSSSCQSHAVPAHPSSWIQSGEVSIASS